MATFTDGKIYQLQSSEQTYIHWNAGIKLKSSCILPIETVQHSGQIEGLWDRTY